jgi:predicted DNA binding protein
LYIRIVGKHRNLAKFTSFLEKFAKLKLQALKNYRLKGRGILTALTNAQYQALKLAVRRGYYSIPRKVALRKLAKERGINHATFSAHLRKAERIVFETLFE